MRQGFVPERWGVTSLGGQTAACRLIAVASLLFGWTASAQSNVVAWGDNTYGEATVPPGLSNVVAVAAGLEHSLALLADGTVTGWGDNYAGEASSPTGLSNVVALAGGGYSSLALRADGTVFGWGYGDYGQTNVPAGLSNVVEIAVGHYHALALRADGTVVAWGYNNYNNYGQTAVPANVSNIVAIAAGDSHSLALRADGTVLGWGLNNVGELYSPVSDVIAIAAGGQHSVALRTDGTTIGFGASPYGNRNYPIGVSNMVAVTDQNDYTTGLRADGAVLTWGYYYYPYVYTNVVSNAVAVATGSGHGVALLANGAPFLLNRLANRTIPSGGTAYFYARGSGAGPLSYQWRFNGTNLPGSTSALLTLPNVQASQAGLYSLRVSNALGSVTSAPALLSVPPIVVVTPPQYQAVLAGGTATFWVVARESQPFSYQWRFNGTNLPNATNSTLVLNGVQPEQGGFYSVVVGNSYGSVTSAPALLDVGLVAAWGNNDSGQTNVPGGVSNAVAVSAGSTHGLTLRKDGRLVEWGSFYTQFGYIPATPPAGLSNVTAIASGFEHDMALRADGTVVSWGMNCCGQTNVPTGLPGAAAAIACGHDHSLVLFSNGLVAAWGDGRYNQSTVPYDATNIIAIACGSYHSLALRADGTVLAWGQNSYLQTQVPSWLSNVVAIASKGLHSLALQANGIVVAWGDNHYGQSTVPIGLSNVIAIATGVDYSLALQRDGSVVGWGYNYSGQATAPGGLTNIVALAGGQYHSLALLGYGPPTLTGPLLDRVGFAGENFYFRATAVGSQPLNYQWRFNGVDISGATNAILALNSPSLAQAGAYSVVVSNSFGAVTGSVAQLLLQPLSITNQPQSFVGYPGAPASFSVGVDGTGPFQYQWLFNGTNLAGATDAVLTLSNAAFKDAGAYSIVASNAYGAVTSQVATLDVSMVAGWGRNNYGQTNVPVGISNLVSIAGGERHSLALRADGTVFGWGDGTYGQLSVPAGLSNVIALASGNLHGLAITSNRLAIGWGYGPQSIVPSGLTNVVAVSGGGNHSLALRADGTVVAWGQNYSGQTNVPANLYGIVAVAAGFAHNLALKGDGTVVAWGDNQLGQSNVPAGVTNIVSIAAGSYHNLALRADGTVTAWGYGGFYSTNIPAGLSNVIAIACGQHHSLALRADGVVFSWGLYDYGGGSYAPMITPDWLTNVVSIAGGSVHSLALAGSGPPFGLTGLADRTVPVGSPVLFSGTASGARPFSYQWRFNGTNLPGATNLVLAISNAQPAHVGVYSLIISNSLGQTTTRDAQLNVPPFVFLSPPGDITRQVGGAVNFTIAVSGIGPISYQWLFNGTNIAGETNGFLTLTNLQPEQAGLYSVTVSNSYGAQTSAAGQLTVPPFIISTQPQNRTNLAGTTASFQVNVQGIGLAYQWLYNGVSIAGATNSALSLSNAQPDQAGAYSVAVSNAYGSANSQSATLTIRPTAEWGGYLQPPGPPLSLSNAVAVALGTYHSLALVRDGRVAAWGANTYGQTNVPANLTNVMAIASGAEHCVALRSNGTVVAWGRNNAGQTSVPFALSNIVAIAAGDYHTMALRSDGTVVAWGSNENFQSQVPSGLANVVAIAGGGAHSLALKADGSVVVWGSNTYGQRNVPAALSNIVAIAGGGSHSLALRADGRVMAWGYNSFGQTNISQDLLLISNVTVVAISAGANHSVALRSDGKIAAWGYNSYGQTTIPAGISNVAAVASSGDRNIVLGSSGAPFLLTPLPARAAPALGNVFFRAAVSGVKPVNYQWRFNGTNLSGATNSVLALSNVFPAQAGLYSVNISNAAGTLENLTAFLDVGMVAGWGAYFNGFSNVPPGLPLGLSNVVSVAAGQNHTLALRENGTVIAWGYNNRSQTNIPPGLTGVVSIACGSDYNLALRASGTVVTWGYNVWGQTTVPADLSNAVAVAAGQSHSLALRADGMVAAWGLNADGQTLVPANLTNAVAVASGANHSLALRSDGTVVAWGLSSMPAVPAAASNVIAIAAGGTCNLALRSDGKVVAWGIGSQTNLPINLSNVLTLACGGGHCLGLRADGNVIGWGTNTYSQANVPSALTNAVFIAAGGNLSLAVLGTGRPFIVAQPVRLQTAPGGKLQLSALVSGAGPLSYQWQLDGVDLASATNATLFLDGIAVSGRYRVRVSNALGTATSLDSIVTTLPAFDPRFATGLAQDGFHLRLAGLTGKRHVLIYASTNLAQWQPIYTNPPVAGILQYIDRTATNLVARFYRGVETDLALGPLRLAGPRVTGTLQLHVAGATGAGSLVVQTSTNLSLWTPLFTNPPVIGEVDFTCPITNSAGFYRVLESR